MSNTTTAQEGFEKFIERTNARIQVIQDRVGQLIELERQSVNNNPRNERLMKYICEKTEILINFVHTDKYTQKRIMVTEQYMQELEVLLNLDE